MRSATKNKVGVDKAYLKWIRSLPCSVPGCNAIFIEPHHAGPRGLSTRVHDRDAIPLCIAHHQNGAGPHAIHGPLGKNWWAFHGIDRKELIDGLNAKYEAEHLGVLNPMDVIGVSA